MSSTEKISRGEEIANSISHGLAVPLAIAAIPILVVNAIRFDDTPAIVAGAIFGTSLLLLYLASSLYHAFPEGKIKDVLQRFDHAAIYILIAGSYTPFTLGVLRGAWGWTLFGIIWGMAAVGIFIKLIAGVRFNTLSTFLYLAMGWLIIVALKPLLNNVPREGFYLLLAGGLSYTVGVIFYALQKYPYMHFVWHLFVLGGSVCHFFAILWYSA